MPRPGWFLAEPLRDGGDGTLLADVLAHIPPRDRRFTPFTGEDPVTQCHENTHVVNSWLRFPHNTGQRPAWNGFYVGANQACLLREPNFRKSQVARFVKERGRNFSLYVTGQRAWDDRPTYLIDELVAYANGSECGIELARLGKWKSGRRRDTLENLVEFMGYADAVVAASRELDPNYADAELLIEVVELHRARTNELLVAAEEFAEFRK